MSMNYLQLGLVQQSIDILKHILDEGIENAERTEGLIKKVRQDLIDLTVDDVKKTMEPLQ